MHVGNSVLSSELPSSSEELASVCNESLTEISGTCSRMPQR